MANATVNFSSALAITNVKLNATAIGTQHILNLELISDEKIEKVELEQSKDGIHFEMMNEMQVIHSNKSYQLIISNPKSNSFYRAKIFSFNKIVISNTILIEAFDRESKIQIYPNPAHHQTSIYFENKNNNKLSVKLLSIDGKELQEIETIKDFITLNTNKYLNGTYIIQLFAEKTLLASKKIFINH